MGKKNKFRGSKVEVVCPDCQELVTPYYDRLYISGNAKGFVQAVCPVCGWATEHQKNVQQCKLEWTKALKDLHIKGKWE